MKKPSMQLANRMSGLLLFLFCTVTAMAQGIGSERYEKYDGIEDLSGESGILILSATNDLVITIENVKDKTIKMRGKNAEGLYEYLVTMNRSETETPNVQVNRRGVVYKTAFVPRLYQGDYIIAYKISEEKDPIRVDESTTATTMVQNASLAVVEVSTTLIDISVEVPSELNATMRDSVSKTDRSIHIKIVTIPIANVMAKRTEVENMKARQAELSKIYNDLPLDDPRGDEFEEINSVLPEKERALQAMQTLYILKPGATRHPISIEDMKGRSKKTYVVVPVKEIVHSSECSDKMSLAAEMYSKQKYKDALSLYEAALTSKGCTEDLRPVINDYIKECNTCVFYDLKLKQALKRAQDLKAGGVAKQEDVFNAINEAYENAQTLHNYTGNDYYEAVLAKFEEVLKAIPINISLTCVEWVSSSGSFSEGGPVANVMVYADYGSSVPDDLPKKGRRFVDKLAHNPRYKLMGQTDASGNIILKLPRDNQPKALVICPLNDNIKLVYKDVKAVLAQSQGSYLERQFRMKMYAK